MAKQVSAFDQSRLHLAASFLRWASFWAFVQGVCFGLVVATIAISWAARWQPGGMRTGPLYVWWETPLKCISIACVSVSVASMYMVFYLTRIAGKCLTPGEGPAKPWADEEWAIAYVTLIAATLPPFWPAIVGAATSPCRRIATELRATPLLRSVESVVRECWIAFVCELIFIGIIIALLTLGGSNNPVWNILFLLTLAVWARLAVQLAILLRRGAKVAEMTHP